MDKKSFLQAGHTPTLLAAFLYFDLAFMVWVLLGPLGIGIAKDLGLSHAEKGMMVATPVLAGALLRIVMGILVDRLSPKKAAIIGQIVVIATMAYAWQVGVHSYAEVLILGLFLGVAGASFAAALPLASRWYPAEHQGTAMGIAGAGNSGTALAALFAPGLAAAFGWVNVFGIVLIPLTIAFIADDGRIVHTADMKPLDESSHCTTESVRYALEMNLGWFREKGLSAGTKVGGIDRLAVQVR